MISVPAPATQPRITWKSINVTRPYRSPTPRSQIWVVRPIRSNSGHYDKLMQMGIWTLVYLLSLLADGPKAPKAEPAIEKNVAIARTELNLQGVTDTASGESRRNENIQFNPIDNNALKDLNVRMGTTATIVQEFDVARNYFGAEFGRPAPAVLHLSPSKAGAMHGNVYEPQNNSMCS